jgi:hypothetical protein
MLPHRLVVHQPFSNTPLQDPIVLRHARPSEKLSLASAITEPLVSLTIQAAWEPGHGFATRREPGGHQRTGPEASAPTPRRGRLRVNRDYSRPLIALEERSIKPAFQGLRSGVQETRLPVNKVRVEELING